MSLLSSTELRLLDERLRELERALLEGIQSRAQQTEIVELDQTRVGRLSRMDALQQQAFAQEADRRGGVRLVQVRAARRRLAENQMGQCADCEEAIGLPRLLGDPCTRLCRDCMEEREAAAAVEAHRRATQGRH